MPLIEVLAAMERIGLKLDAERLAEIGDGMEEQIAELEREIYELAGTSSRSARPSSSATVLFEELELTKKRRGKTGFSTDARVLAQIRDEHPVIDKVELARADEAEEHLPRLAADAGRPRDGRIHTTFNQVDGRHRAPLEHQPEPPEHPDPVRDRAPRPRRASSPSRGMRLFG